MDRQCPPNRPRYQPTRGLNRFKQRKRCYDVTLSRQEGSSMRPPPPPPPPPLVNAQWDRPTTMVTYRATFSVVLGASLHQPDWQLSIG